PSKPAHAQLMLGGIQGSSDPNEIGGAWVFAFLVTMGAMVPQSFAADALIRGKPNMDRTAGGAILGVGVATAAGTTIGLGFSRNQEGSTALSMMGGMLWSAAGVGLGRTVSNDVNAPWLGGSMGFTTFAFIHGLMEVGELSDNTGASVMQAI